MKQKEELIRLIAKMLSGLDVTRLRSVYQFVLHLKK